MNYFERLCLDGAGNVKPQLSRAELAALVAAARLLVEAEAPDYDRADRLLEAGMAAAASAPTQTRSNAAALRLVAIAGRGEVAAAGKLLGKITDSPRDAWIAMLASLESIGRKTPPDSKRALAELQLCALDQFAQLHQARPADRDRLTAQRASALAEVGQRRQALALWQSLAKERPGDGQVQENVASLLMQSSDAAEQKAALAKWREIEGKSRSGSPRWFRAQLALAQVHFNLGHKSQARAIIKLAELSRPELGGEELKASFRKLLAECEK
jgi:hypothetical protein